MIQKNDNDKWYWYDFKNELVEVPYIILIPLTRMNKTFSLEKDLEIIL